MNNEQESLLKVLGYNWSARYKITWMVMEKGSVIEYIDDEVTTLRDKDGVCEINLYGEVTWIG